jgi:secondary thiamine-phosphate synthase enzyme
MNRKTISLQTNKREELLDITSQVQKAVSEIMQSGSGIALVFSKHTTSGITINENADRNVKSDILLGLKDIVRDLDFKHLEGNSNAHIKSSLIGPSITVLVDEGKLMLGTWQGIMFCEFDGPRTREVVVSVIKDNN